MEFCWTTFAALFLLFAAVSCAPVESSLQDACANVSNSSLAFNQILVQFVSEKKKNGSQYMNSFPISTAWMEDKDKCGPGALKNTHKPCIAKMLDVLTNYTSVMEWLSGLPNCSKFVHEVMPKIKDLYKDMSKCVKGTGTIRTQIKTNYEYQEMKKWNKDLICFYVMDRLFSFSILTARVFAVGDPAHHEDKCVKNCVSSLTCNQS